MQIQVVLLGELLCPKNVSFSSVVEKPKGGRSTSPFFAPIMCAPTHSQLYSVRDCRSTKDSKGGRVNGQGEEKKKKMNK